MRWVGHVARRVRRDVYRVFLGKLERKRLLGRSRHRREVNNEMDHQEVGCGGMEWIDLNRTGTVAGHL